MEDLSYIVDKDADYQYAEGLTLDDCFVALLRNVDATAGAGAPTMRILLEKHRKLIAKSDYWDNADFAYQEADGVFIFVCRRVSEPLESAISRRSWPSCCRRLRLTGHRSR